MNLAKLFETQKVLRDRINYNEPDRFNKLVLALLVELGELANEQRSWKFWSKDQSPRVQKSRAPYMDLDDADFYNPLLEEYVDGLHFLLELGIELVNYQQWEPEYEQNITEQFRTIYYHVGLLDEFVAREEYDHAAGYYLGLGEMLGFTWEQIESAYFAKNAVNHTRQANGY